MLTNKKKTKESNNDNSGIFNKLSNKTSDMDLNIQELSNRLEELESSISKFKQQMTTLEFHESKIRGRMAIYINIGGHARQKSIATFRNFFVPLPS